MPASRETYTKLIWVNDSTKLNATNLNHIEVGVETNNVLAKENATYIDEIYKALVELFLVTYNHTARTLTFTLGDPNQTSRFNFSKSVLLSDNFYDKTEVDTLLSGKQATLVSASNIKTIAGVSILGSGNISFDSQLDNSSVNAPQTKAVKEALDNKLNKSTTPSVVYGVDSSGSQKEYELDTTSESVTSFGDLPVRRSSSNGNIPVPLEPLANNDAASKKYVDDHHDASKQNVLTFDNTPTANSNNPVKSGGVKAELDKKQDKLTAGTGITITENNVISYNGAQFSLSVVESLPTTGTANTFYFVPATDSETNNEYEEYVYVNNKWELVGKTSIDLSNFYTKQEINSALALKQNTLTSGTDIKTVNNQSILGPGNINIEAGAKKLTGAELEDMEYVAGQLYYCTSSSDSFSANTLYLAKGPASIYPISTGAAISTTPAITSFSISPTTTEVGHTITPTYSYTLKKYGSISNVKLDNSLLVATPSSASGNGTVSTAYDSHTFTLTASYSGGTLSKSATLTAQYRQFYGVVAGSTVSEVLANLKNVTSNINNLKTYLSNSLPSGSISLTLGSTPVYVYLIVKSSLTITTVKSGGFDVPVTLLDTQTFTNSYNSQYSVKVYRTDNKVYGDMTINVA